jgi:hypothetical protein
MPDTKENAKVFEKLALNNSYEIRDYVANKDNISKKTIKILLTDKRHDIITTLLRNTKVANKLTPRQVKDIISLGNPAHCEAIASNFNDFAKCNICKLAKILSNHNDPNVRAKLVSRWNNDIPKNIIKKLTKDKDIDVVNTAKEKLKK